jgi:hypothetical protein
MSLTAHDAFTQACVMPPSDPVCRSGNGLIDEGDVKKVALGGRGEIHPRSVMEAAAEALRDTFGLEVRHSSSRGSTPRQHARP